MWLTGAFKPASVVKSHVQRITDICLEHTVCACDAPQIDNETPGFHIVAMDPIRRALQRDGEKY